MDMRNRIETFHKIPVEEVTHPTEPHIEDSHMSDIGQALVL